MYQASVPRLANMLENLSKILDKAQAHADAGKTDVSSLMNDRLAPDMYPLSKQVQITCDKARSVVARLAGMDVPFYEDDEKTLAELKVRIARSVAFIRSVPADWINGTEDDDIVLPVTGNETRYKGMLWGSAGLIAGGEAQDRRNPGVEVLERMIAATLHRLPRAGIERDRLTIIEHLVTRLHEQEVSVGLREIRDGDRAQLVEMRSGHLEGLARVQICLCPEPGLEVLPGTHRRIDQHGAGTEVLGEMCRVEAAERTSDKGQRCTGPVLARDEVEHLCDRRGRSVSEIGNDKCHARRCGECGDRTHQRLRLRRLRRRAEAVQVDDERRQCSSGRGSSPGATDATRRSKRA